MVAGASFGAIACRFHVGRMSVQRHRKEHLVQLLARIYDATELERAESLLASIKKGSDDMRRSIHLARTEGNYIALAILANAEVKRLTLLAEVEHKMH